MAPPGGSHCHLLAWGPDQPATPGDRVRGKCGDPHRDDRPFGRWKGPHHRQELIGARPVDDPQDRVPAWGQTQCPLTPVFGLLVPLDEASTDEAIYQSAGRRW